MKKLKFKRRVNLLQNFIYWIGSSRIQPTLLITGVSIKRITPPHTHTQIHGLSLWVRPPLGPSRTHSVG